MNNHSPTIYTCIIGSILVLSSVCSTDAQGQVVIDTVAVGNVGNAADSTGFGSVNYQFNIGRTEVTNSQYSAFLNAVDPLAANGLSLYNSQMNASQSGGIQMDATAAAGSRYSVKTGRGNNAVNYVNSVDAMRFANWMHNGQGTGSTEAGAYTINTSNFLLTVRNAGARWALTSEDEWYKAAYHANDGVTGNYSRYPTQSNSKPFSAPAPGTASPDVANAANIYFDDGIANGYDDGYASNGQTNFPIGNPLFNVGAYDQTTSAYGLFDVAGSMHEWNESVIGSNRGFRGGSFWSGSFGLDLDDSFERFGGISNGFEERDFGFRLTGFLAVFGDVNMDGVLNLLDVSPFVQLLSTGVYQSEADTNLDGVVDLLDVSLFIELLSAS